MGRYVGLKACNMGYDAHLTIHYLGRVPNGVEDIHLKRIEELVEEHKNFATRVHRIGFDMFGYGKIPVILVNVGIDLLRLKQDCEGLLESRSEYQWNPHITLKTNHNNTITIPPSITLDRLAIYD